ncbi:MAG: acetylornithine deacetylase [Holophagae bacterium]|nr:MAG: acetylornithine deacetylase [Holophagae bacterium]
MTVDDAELLEICRRLVAFDTVSTASNVACAEYLADLLDDAGWQVRLHRDHALGADKASLVAWSGPPFAGGLVLSGHMDVVPHADQPGWTRDPLAMAADGERIYGRGVADMKTFLAQCIVVARELDRSRLVRPLVLLFTCDEEAGCLGAARLAPHLRSLLGELPLPGECLIGEPTGFEVFIAHKGHVRLTVRIDGRGGHSSRPDLGTNAIAAMAEAAAELNVLEQDLLGRTTLEGRLLFPEFPAAAINLGMISGGTADNMIADRCELTIGLRPLPGDDPELLVREVELRMSEAVRRRFPAAEISLVEREVTPAMSSPPGGRLAQTLARLTGCRELRGAPFATDGGRLEAIGLNSVICGPGELEQAHRPDESLPIASLWRGSELIREVVARLCC